MAPSWSLEREELAEPIPSQAHHGLDFGFLFGLYLWLRGTWINGVFFNNATFITTQTHYLQYYYKLTTIEITYTTYDTIAYATVYNAFTNPTHADYLLTLHIITYTTYKCDSYTLQTNL